MSDIETVEKIKNQIKNDVVLYMKGNFDFPACGFSAKVVHMLKQSGLTKKDILIVNVLEDAILREEIKIFSNWPTIPQLYIRGEFIGGCDIVQELFQKDELDKMLVGSVKNK